MFDATVQKLQYSKDFFGIFGHPLEAVDLSQFHRKAMYIHNDMLF